jgi:hypothetical protein
VIAATVEEEARTIAASLFASLEEETRAAAAAGHTTTAMAEAGATSVASQEEDPDHDLELSVESVDGTPLEQPSPLLRASAQERRNMQRKGCLQRPSCMCDASAMAKLRARVFNCLLVAELPSIWGRATVVEAMGRTDEPL